MRSYRHISFRCALLAAALALAGFASVVSAQNYDFQIVHDFSDSPGGGPINGVHFDNVGNLYGTTLYGGSFNGGTLYKIANDGTESILYSFERVPASPGEGLVLPSDITVDPTTGDIYGTTSYGPDNTHFGQIYKLAADGTFITLYIFDPDRDGVASGAGLLRDRQGNLYGTLAFGTGGSRSKLYRYGADGSFRVLHIFKDLYGLSPLIYDGAGSLYGVGHSVAGCGELYKLALDGTFTTLYTFTPGDDHGCAPETLTGDRMGNLYVTTTSGGASTGFETVFKFSSDGTFTTLHTFSNDAFGPQGFWRLSEALPVDGNVYVIANYQNGRDNQYNLVYRIAPDGTYTKSSSFPRGPIPNSILTLRHGRFYGTTEYGYDYVYSFGPTEQ